MKHDLRTNRKVSDEVFTVFAADEQCEQNRFASTD